MLFANHGLPNKIVTDNGPSSTSEEFKIFMEEEFFLATNVNFHLFIYFLKFFGKILKVSV